MPKPKAGEIIPPLDEDDDPKPQTWIGRKLAEAKTKMEEMQKQAEGQRQIRNDPKPNLDNLSRNERRAQKRKKK